VLNVYAVKARAGAFDGDAVSDIVVKLGRAIQNPIAAAFYHQYKLLLVPGQRAAQRVQRGIALLGTFGELNLDNSGISRYMSSELPEIPETIPGTQYLNSKNSDLLAPCIFPIVTGYSLCYGGCIPIVVLITVRWGLLKGRLALLLGHACSSRLRTRFWAAWVGGSIGQTACVGFQGGFTISVREYLMGYLPCRKPTLNERTHRGAAAASTNKLRGRVPR
jgi:hypothetical protein